MTTANDVNVGQYLSRLFAESHRRWACRGMTPEQVFGWQLGARAALVRLLGLPCIEERCSGHSFVVRLRSPEAADGFTRQQGEAHTEPGVSIRFWFFRPEGDGPFPVALLPHGHEHFGLNTYAGISTSAEHARRIREEDRDVALQAVRRGMVAIAPVTRGFFPAAVPDRLKRHGGQHCRSQALHCFLAGRTAIGERVWDMMRLLDWVLGLADTDSERVLVMGNSGGGMVTLYTAACDERVTMAVPSCSFCTIAGCDGDIHHCDCNAVPGLFQFGEMWDIAGLIAPRRLLAVNGRQDTLFPLSEVDRAVHGVERIYRAAGCPSHFSHCYGEGGHRFYSDLMWPAIGAVFGFG